MSSGGGILSSIKNHEESIIILKEDIETMKTEIITLRRELETMRISSTIEKIMENTSTKPNIVAPVPKKGWFW